MRRQRQRNTVVIFFIFLLVLGGIFLFAGAALRRGALGILSPVLKLQGYWGGAEKQLPREEALVAAFAAKEEEYNREIDSLNRMLDLKGNIKAKTHAARVVWYGTELGKEFLILDEGEDVDFHEGDIAVNADGFLLGTVREVAAHTSKISLASNPGEAYEVDFSPLAARALARGIGGRAFSIELIPADFPVRAGDVLLLRGVGGAAPFLGTIAREDPNGGAALKQARAVLFADPGAAKEVLIISSKHAIN